jgi:hypothetical protein
LLSTMSKVFVNYWSTHMILQLRALVTCYPGGWGIALFSSHSSFFSITQMTGLSTGLPLDWIGLDWIALNCIAYNLGLSTNS